MPWGKMMKTSEELFTANTHPQIREGLRLTAHQGKHNPYNSLVDPQDRGNQAPSSTGKYRDSRNSEQRKEYTLGQSCQGIRPYSVGTGCALFNILIHK